MPGRSSRGNSGYAPTMVQVHKPDRPTLSPHDDASFARHAAPHPGQQPVNGDDWTEAALIDTDQQPLLPFSEEPDAPPPQDENTADDANEEGNTSATPQKTTGREGEGLKLPEGVRPPTYKFSPATWHWWWNWLTRRRDREDPTLWRVPKPGKREQAARDREAALIADYEARMMFKLQLVMAVTRLRALLIVPQLVLDFNVSNQRGQSHKSVISALIGSAITAIGRINALWWTATLNTSVGGAADLSGIAPELLANSRLSTVVTNAKKGKYKSAQDVFNGPNKLAVTNTGLVVVVEDLHGDDGRRRPRLTPNAHEDAFYTVRPHVPGPSIKDGGNDGLDDGNFVYRLANGATIQVVVGDSNRRGSLTNMRGAYNALRSAPEDFGKGPDAPEYWVSLHEKAANAVFVASDVAEGVTFDFEPWLTVDTQLNYETPPRPFEGALLTTPHEPSLEPTDPNKPVVLNWFSLTREMQLAGMNIVIEGAKLAAKMQHIGVGFVENLEPEFDTAAVLLNLDVSDVKSWYERNKLDIAPVILASARAEAESTAPEGVEHPAEISVDAEMEERNEL